MENYIEYIIDSIERKNPSHSKKLKENLKDLGEEYFNLANPFYEKYEEYLKSQQLTLDYGVDFYLKMIEAMLDERLAFIQNGRYSNTSFEEVEKNVYATPEVMSYHMHGLVLAQFLWFDQYERIKFFIDNVYKYFLSGKNYLEIGGGHGLYIYKAVEILPIATKFDLVDISESSLKIAKGILNNDKINFYLKNIFDFANDDVYDFITIGEVLEHVENPKELLMKIGKHLAKDGVCYMTTPVNAPMIDHIYLFNNVQEIRNLINEAGFEIIEEKTVISEKITPEKAAKFKVPVMYAAFIKKQD
ncbi:class I SAM-dependent methyltransferase [Frigoriflavimonas asaccharolytica]|uniref:Ubiquinone/menaquinone biosynthesis C-methylase UbiE n=1 Tax=Frigoriflavimonas asaccharolytica TaxID=2735899 RepID=A0A8J8G9Y8_9FLAO|nr:class I SAM-dependent methyltransferase [Frigoriflavimonas asaccharolytica]NRS92652.1 ubiquinone/menaquinone biosynthesis C-methylase UbiE [Frigoriflavimonas asaccharolytica]